MFNKEGEKGVLIELEGKGIYVYIHDCKSKDGIVGRGLSRDIVTYKCKECPAQQIYEEILRRFKNLEDIQK